MNSTPDSTSRRQAWTDWLVVLFFMGIIWLPTVDYFGHVDFTRPPDENRLMAPKPKLTQWSIAGVQNYLVATEAYFNDHFGFRKRLVRWYQHWKERIFRNPSTNLVVQGQDGWYYISERQMFDHYLGLILFTPHQLESWQRLLEKRRDWLAARGMKYLFVVPPDKQTIYPEYLPAWLAAATPPNRQTKMDQFFAYMRVHSTVEVLDLRSTLVAGKQIAPTYLKNDTHWNLFGGFLTAQEVIKALSRQVPELPPLRLEDFVWTNAPFIGGDLTGTLGMRPPEKNFFAFTPKPPHAPLQTSLVTNLIRLWNPRDTNKANWLVENTKPPPGAADMVVFHDSYAKAWRPFMGYSSHRILFVWEDKEFNPQIIMDNHPKIVVNEMLERMFYTENPDEMLAKEALP